jgi:hypothetical protein
MRRRCRRTYRVAPGTYNVGQAAREDGQAGCVYARAVAVASVPMPARAGIVLLGDSINEHRPLSGAVGRRLRQTICEASRGESTFDENDERRQPRRRD